MISIALCTYNGDKFLREQLDSIALQTLPPDEMVVCDDGSTDGTLDILQEFSDRATFTVHIYQNENNLGSTKNFEKVIGLCSGEVIALCDQDDIWKPQKLGRLVAELQRNPAAGYVFSDAELVDEGLKPLKKQLWESIRFHGKIKERYIKGDQFCCLLKKTFVTGATMAFRRPLAKLAMPFPTEGHRIHDSWIALVLSATGHMGIAVDDTLIAYRQHEHQQLGGLIDNQTLLAAFRELKEHNQALFSAWETDCLQVLRLKGTLQQMENTNNSPVIEQTLYFLQEFEMHFFNRRRILASNSLFRYRLILLEIFSGRYKRFSDSWRSTFRDIFLR